MRRFLIAVAVAATSMAIPCVASAGVLVSIDKSTQRMTVSVDGRVAHVWPVSTGRAGYGTPNGSYRPQRMARTWFSRKYYNSPMPHSIFFHGGFAIHGSYEIRRLGGPASHGCVRLHPANAAKLFALIQREGMGATRISISGASPAVAARRARKLRATAVARPVYRDYDAAKPRYRPAYRDDAWGERWNDD
ncbi:MAG: L,D-transpeptidase [Variibacter sp.]